MIPKKHTSNKKKDFVSLLKSWFGMVQEEGEALLFDKEMSSSDEGSNKYKKRKHKLWKLLGYSFLALTAVFVLFKYVSNISGSFSPSDPKYIPKSRSFYTYEVEQDNPLIFPAIENQPALKKAGLEILFTKGTQGNFVVNLDQKPMSDKQKKQLLASTENNDKVLYIKNQFIDHGRVVYGGSKKESPETVIVTLVDYDSYGLDSTVKIVQNRVDYCQKQGYGLYVRWIQEFIPFIEDQDLSKQINQDFIKFLIMRQAMYAFPHAKNFWFLDKNALIMNMNMNLESQIFSKTNKHMIENDLVYLKSHIIQDAPVKTHGNLWKKNAKTDVESEESTFTLRDTQFSYMFAKQYLPIENIDTSSFLMKNDMYSHALLDYMNDPLFRQYSWQSVQQALSHCLQWHPLLMRNLIMIREKIIGSFYDPNPSKNSVKNEDAVTDAKKDAYYEGHFVIKFRDCLRLKTCNSLLTEYYNLIEK
ncbi:unnamed protein product [Hanseniaspora opuntiae]|uniref:Putative alpha-1,6-mannosyltransferase MNN11 n=1 Tax=Hanseniaspora opuntiae TaxID=211096 RepID=A0A1E5RWX4_9ASCO|nr:putative alpha-1,6-mannosyltransferase MNN11 [Hanseniaspora opuntiae]